MKKNINKSLPLFILAVLMLSSCVICAWHTALGLTNCTTDTLYFGVSGCDNIDSVHCSFDSRNYNLPADSDNIFSWGETGLSLYAVYPDSLCICEETDMFLHGDTCYIFVLEKHIAQNNTWDDIRQNKLYDKITYIRDETEPEVLNYRGKKN